MATIVGRTLLGGLRRVELRRTFGQMIALRRYYRDGQAARDPREVRKKKTAEAIGALLSGLSSEDLPAAELIVDYFAEDLVNSVEDPPGPDADSPEAGSEDAPQEF